MTASKAAGESTGKVSVRFKQYREAMSKEFGFSFTEFCKETGIPEQKFRAYEKGELRPNFADLQKIGMNTGVNLNWLVYNNGGMFGAREKDLEELIQKIETDENCMYKNYKMLLKLMQVPDMEALIFGIQKVFLSFLSKTDFVSKLKEPGKLEELLVKIPTKPEA